MSSSPTPSEREKKDKEDRAREAEEQAKLPYKWTQTIQDLDITVPVPSNLRGKDIVVDMTKTKLKVGVKGQEPFIDACAAAVPHPAFCYNFLWDASANPFVYNRDPSHMKSTPPSPHGRSSPPPPAKISPSTSTKPTSSNGGPRSLRMPPTSSIPQRYSLRIASWGIWMGRREVWWRK